MQSENDGTEEHLLVEDVQTDNNLHATDDAKKDAMESSSNKMVLSRNVYTQEALDEEYTTDELPGPSCSNRIKSACSCNKRKLWKIVSSYVPVIRFARYYKPREYALGDFLSGLTVSFMHLPQAMGFGILASLKPIHGLYSTFFPVLVYLIFGTSPYISFGTNAVMALLTQTVVEREADKYIASIPINDTAPTDDEILAVKVGTAMALSFLAGLILTAMGLLRLGFITTYLSTSFVGGFTTAAAIHIASSQVPKMFGIKVASFSGAGKLVRMYVDLFSKIEQTRVAELIITVICMIVLLLVKICINEKYNKKMKMPIPIDLIVVIVGTLISHFAKFNDLWGVKVVGSIPNGFDTPAAPRLVNASSFIADAFVMAVLSLAMSISMAKLTAKKHGVPLDDNQELIGYGLSNLVSGFFSCFPSATAPPRTMILSSLGAKTTLNAIATSVFMLFVILLIGPLFASLPLSVLAAMIIVSMKELLLQYRNLPTIWKVNKYDFIIWLATNLMGVLVDLDYGLMVGVGISIFLVVAQNQLSTSYRLSISSSEDLLLKSTRSRNIEDPKDVKIFKFTTGLYFATADRFKSQIYKEVLNPQIYKKQLAKLKKRQEEELQETLNTGQKFDNGNAMSNGEVDNQELKTIIIDCSSMNYMDMAGSNMIKQVIKEYGDVDKNVLLVGLPDKPRDVLQASDFFTTFSKQKCFVDVFDALEALRPKTVSQDQTKM